MQNTPILFVDMDNVTFDFLGGPKKNCRAVVDRARRKAARRVVIEGDTE